MTLEKYLRDCWPSIGVSPASDERVTALLSSYELKTMLQHFQAQMVEGRRDPHSVLSSAVALGFELGKNYAEVQRLEEMGKL